ncbi:MAG: hypothetical protein HC911_17875 [Chloroflexaceae bacterium]|nr:hypothetical protein [Chloroflexaceae bacterium]
MHELLNPADWLLPAYAEDETATDALRQVQISTSSDGLKTCVASDGAVLAMRSTSRCEAMPDCTIDIETAAALRRLIWYFSVSEPKVSVARTSASTLIEVQAGVARLYFRVNIQGYPDWKKIIPDIKATVSSSTKDLMRAVELLHGDRTALERDKASVSERAVEIRATKKTLKLSGNGNEVSMDASEVQGVVDPISVDGLRLWYALHCMSGFGVRLGLSNVPRTPISLECGQDTWYVMPIGHPSEVRQ